MHEVRHEEIRKTLDAMRPELCCQQYATCIRPCTPRGQWIAADPLLKSYREMHEISGKLSIINILREIFAAIGLAACLVGIVFFLFWLGK